MINIDDFVKRLEIILDYYGLNASSFADKIGVQRSSMSHLLSGRNRPSLDFVLKILDVFPEIDLYWILIGKGAFPKNIMLSDEINTAINNQSADDLHKDDLVLEDEYLKKKVEENNEKKKIVLNESILTANDNEIEKIVLFYKNGTFKAYIP